MGHSAIKQKRRKQCGVHKNFNVAISGNSDLVIYSNRDKDDFVVQCEFCGDALYPQGDNFTGG